MGGELFMKTEGLALACLAAVCLAQEAPAWRDPSPHSVVFVNVGNNINLEVLDWGGSGRPLVLLAGIGNTAHVFDEFAPKLTGSHRVYGITRRGHGASSAPSSGYSADSLGDDVRAVVDSLKLNRPVLVGHSIAGEELSSVGTRHPEEIAGLIYLEAGYSYAYYDRTRGDLDIDLLDLQKKIGQLQAAVQDPSQAKAALKKDLVELQRQLKQLQSLDGPEDPKYMQLVRRLLQTNLPGLEKDLQESQTDQRSPSSKVVQELLQENLPGFEHDLRETQENLQTAPTQPPPARPKQTAADRATFLSLRAWQIRTQGWSDPEAELRQANESMSDGRIGKPRAWVTSDQADDAILAGIQKYADLRVPTLAIYAIKPNETAADKAQAKAFELGVQGARVIRLPNARHMVFLSNEADVLREMNAFLDDLR